MPVFTSHPAGTPCWVDLSSPDVDAAKAFHTAVFGWDAVDEYDGDQRIYTQFFLDGHVVAGLGGQAPGMEGMPAVWNTYIATSDPAGVAAAVEANGGTVVMPPMQVMTAGHMAVFQDPTGAFFSVWQAGEHFGAAICNEPNTYSWNELLTRDIATATSFYAAVFGWTYEETEMGPDTIYHVVEGGDHGGLAGLMAMPPEMPPMVPNHWAVYFTVTDLEASLAAATAAGGQVVQPPMSVPGVGSMATVHHTAGGSFCLMQPEQPAG